jgi:acyl-CoA reductase-like NAD-dependent aldehyde dehydrogenase
MGVQISVRNPRSGKVDYWITPPTPEQLAAECTRLREAQIDWQQGGLERRIEAMQAWKQAILSHKDELTKALVADTGRGSVSGLEFDSFISGIDRWCRLAPELLAKEDEKATAIPFIRCNRNSSLTPWSASSVRGIFHCCFLLLIPSRHCWQAVPLS